MAPSRLPVRPTTDLAKESLFNILSNSFDMEEISVLDLFSGTGNIAYEFTSRGCPQVLSVDVNGACCKFIQETIHKLKMDGMNVIKADVFKYLKQGFGTYDIIFADPPYDHPRIAELPALVAESNLLKEGGWFIMEHPSFQHYDNLPNFKEQRKYGQSSFSFFEY